MSDTRVFIDFASNALKLKEDFTGVTAAHKRTTDAMKGHYDQYAAGAMASVKNLHQLEIDWAGKSTKKLVGFIHERTRERRMEEDAMRRAVLDMDEVETRKHKNRLLQINEEQKSLRILSNERKEVQTGGAGALIGQFGIGRQLTAISSPLMGFGDMTAGLRTAALATAGVLALTETLKLGKEAFSAIEGAARRYEDGNDRLAISLTRSGLAGKNLDRMVELMGKHVDDLSVAFAKPRDEIAETMASVAAFSRTGGEKLTQLTELTIGVAEATKMPLEQVARLIGRVSDPEIITNAASRYGIVIDKNMTQTERIKALYDQFGGTIDETKRRMDEGVHSWDQLTNKVSLAAEKFALKAFRELTPTFRELKPKIDTVFEGLSEIKLGPGIERVGKLIHFGVELGKAFDPRYNYYTRWILAQQGYGKTAQAQAFEDWKANSDKISSAFNKSLGDMKDSLDESDLSGKITVPAPAVKDKNKTIEEINREHFAKLREDVDTAQAKRLNDIRIAVNDEKMTVFQGRQAELKSNIEYNTELEKLTQGRKGLERDYLSEVRSVSLDESEIRAGQLAEERKVFEEKKRFLEEWKQVHESGIQYINTLDKDAHEQALALIDDEYDANVRMNGLTEESKKEYQKKILAQNTKDAQAHLETARLIADNNIGIAEAEKQLHDARHAQNMFEADEQIKADAERNKSTKEWVDVGLKPAASELSKIVSDSLKLPGIFQKIAAGFIDKGITKGVDWLSEKMFDGGKGKPGLGPDFIGPQIPQVDDMTKTAKEYGGPMLNGHYLMLLGPDDVALAVGGNGNLIGAKGGIDTLSRKPVATESTNVNMEFARQRAEEKAAAEEKKREREEWHQDAIRQAREFHKERAKVPGTRDATHGEGSLDLQDVMEAYATVETNMPSGLLLHGTAKAIEGKNPLPGMEDERGGDANTRRSRTDASTPTAVAAATKANTDALKLATSATHGLSAFMQQGVTGNKNVHAGAGLAKGLFSVLSAIPGIGIGADAASIIGGGLGLFDNEGDFPGGPTSGRDKNLTMFRSSKDERISVYRPQPSQAQRPGMISNDGVIAAIHNMTEVLRAKNLSISTGAVYSASLSGEKTSNAITLD